MKTLGLSTCIICLIILCAYTKRIAADPNDPNGNGWDIRLSVPGEPDIDYPVLGTIPYTSFTCFGRPFGYYADAETRCQVFRVCAHTATGPGGFFSFVCPNGTLFNQQHMVCDWWMNVRCDDLESQYPDVPVENLAIKSPAAMMANIKAMITYPMRNPYPLIPAIKTTTQVYNPPQSMLRQQFNAGFYSNGNELANNAFAVKNANVLAQAERFANTLNSAQETFARIQASNKVQVQNQYPFIPRTGNKYPLVVTVPINFPSASPLQEPPNVDQPTVETFNRSYNTNEIQRSKLKENPRNESRAANHNYDIIDEDKPTRPRHFTANVASQTNVFISNMTPRKKDLEEPTSTVNPDSESFAPGELLDKSARLTENIKSVTNEISNHNESLQLESSSTIITNSKAIDNNLVTLLSAHIIPGGDVAKQKVLKLCIPKDVLSYLLKLHNSTKSIYFNSQVNTGELMNEPFIKRIMQNFLMRNNISTVQVPEVTQQRYENEQKISTVVEATKTSIINQSSQSVQKTESHSDHVESFQTDSQQTLSNTSRYSEHVSKGVSSFNNNNRSSQQNQFDASGNQQIQQNQQNQQSQQNQNQQNVNGYYSQSAFDNNNQFNQQNLGNRESVQTSGQTFSQRQMQSNNGGFNRVQNNNAGFSQTQNTGFGQSQNQNQNAGYNQVQNSNSGFSQNQNNNAGFSQTQNSNAGFSQIQNTNMGYNQIPNNNAGFNQNTQSFTQQRLEEGGVKGQKQTSSRDFFNQNSNRQSGSSYNGFTNSQYTNQNVPTRQITQYRGSSFMATQSGFPQTQQYNNQNQYSSQGNNFQSNRAAQQNEAEFDGYSERNQFGAITTNQNNNQQQQQQQLSNTSRYEHINSVHHQVPIIRITNDQIFHNPYVNGRIQNAAQIEKNSETFADKIQIVHPATVNETAEFAQYVQPKPNGGATYSSYEFSRIVRPTFSTLNRQTGIVYAQDRVPVLMPTQETTRNYDSNTKAFAQIKKIFPHSNTPAGFMLNQQVKMSRQQERQPSYYSNDNQYGYQANANYDNYQNGQTDEKGYTTIEVVPALGFALDSQREKQDYISGISTGHRHSDKIYVPPYQESAMYTDSNGNKYQMNSYQGTKSGQYNRVAFVEQQRQSQQQQQQQPQPQDEDYGYPQEKPEVAFTF